MRILLSHSFAEMEPASESPNQSGSFWADPDVRWLLAVNEARGILYFNKECFEELSWWLELPELVKNCDEQPSNADALMKIEQRPKLASNVAQQAGYEVRKYFIPKPVDAPQSEKLDRKKNEKKQTSVPSSELLEPKAELPEAELEDEPRPGGRVK